MEPDEISQRIEELQPLVAAVKAEMAKVVVGQFDLIEGLLIGLFTKGHILLEGVPGLAKTTAVKALAAAVHARFKRIQFTPDLLPADILGNRVYHPETGSFSTKKGPLFNNIILADEINRAPSKVQSALLEAMQERQITIGEETFPLDDPFLVLATQNPIEHEGTYPLPEAQVDRFMLKIILGYPSMEDEREIVKRHGSALAEPPQAVLTRQGLDSISRVIQNVYIDDAILEYILRIVFATRFPGESNLGDIAGFIEFGASPRASICLSEASRARAFLHGREYVVPDDIKAVALPVLRHRLILTYEAEAESQDADAVIHHILAHVPTP
ncbi:AAA family ATPase [Desulfovibrio inopinatus]|uniref:AAA family ATPase n=1 Tax=Desulfovibrio inopinatus TaxID=102109 RepID=UPI00040F56A0|nr:MoxR family ATPase [Desulfovibrio inopinatus]